MVKMWIIFIFVLFSWDVTSIERQFLNNEWYLINNNKDISVSARVPGGVYSDLMSAGILNDIYYRFNDIQYRWVANESWVYQTSFEVNTNYSNSKVINLVFDGLDTFSLISINSVFIGKSENMFVKYTFDIKPFIKEGTNDLIIIFKSPIQEAQRLYDQQAKDYIVPPVCVPDDYNGECHANFVRKMQASFSWDWGPAFPSMGIWKPVYIEYFNSTVLRDVIVQTIPEDEFWILNLSIFLESNSKIIEGSLDTELSTDIATVTTFTHVKAAVSDNGEYKQDIILKVPRLYVDLWWPNGYGQQKLYDLKVTFNSAIEKEFSSKKIRIGFRTIELVQNSVEKGLTFYFKVNNIPIFSKGSNWIPANILPEEGARESNIRFLLQSAKAVHMNMLRVWGGGVYESDLFYDLADELGILIWQDFMFACSMYPVDKNFLNLVKVEIAQQVRRLQHHASIAIWAGNNENESALRDNWYGTEANFSLYQKDYIELYVNTIREVCLNNDNTRPFVVSSPSNGLQSEKEGYVAKNPSDTHFGDVHYYNYILDGWNQNIYPRARFVSEYGYQSLPSIETLKTATNITTDLILTSEFLQKRQHHTAGYSQMKILINKNLELPDNSHNEVSSLDEVTIKEEQLKTDIQYLNTFIYFSQISQAMSIKQETEYYRQWRSFLDENGRGLTMGALYWQLNDVWQAPSWSSIDFKRKWKMLHYYAQKFFHPVLVSANIGPAGLMSLYVISDLTTIILNATITINVFKWDSFTPISTEKMIRSILPGYSNPVYDTWLDQYLVKAGCGDLEHSKKRCFIELHIEDMSGNPIGYENFVFPTALKHIEGLSTPNLSVNVHKGTGSDVPSSSFNITITADKLALFVWLETPNLNGLFSDNGFLQISKSRVVQYKIDKKITPLELQFLIKVTSLLSKEHLLP